LLIAGEGIRFWLCGLEAWMFAKLENQKYVVSKKLTISLMNERREGGEYIMLVFSYVTCIM
jgi:hypothetical protein